MVITTANVVEILSQLAAKMMTREDAQSWAIEKRDALDERRLDFVPESDKDRIWDALQFVELYAEQIEPATYLYSETDLLLFMKTNGWK